MRYILLSFCSIFYVLSVQAQSVQIIKDASTQNNDPQEFPVAGFEIPITNTNVDFEDHIITSHVSTSGLSVILSNNEISMYDAAGISLFDVDYTIGQDDNSNKIYLSNNGEFVLRENIANFLFYDSSGKIRNSISNSSQSSEGESVSQLASDPAFKTTVLYNPKIRSNGVDGSRAGIVNNNRGITTIFNIADREISLVEVSENGQFIAVISYRSGKDDEVFITDRFGNEINTISFDQTVKGVAFSDDGKHITIYSNSRVGAYNVITGAREGSTSFRAPVQVAEYFPADNTILALTANETNAVLSNVEMHVINVSARSIARQGFDERLGKTDLISTDIVRNGTYNYTLSGLSTVLNIKATF